MASRGTTLDPAALNDIGQDIRVSGLLDAEMHLVSRGVGLSITSEAVGLWYKRPGVTFVPILDLTPCSVSLAWWPQDTGLIAELVAVANEVRARIAQI